MSKNTEFAEKLAELVVREAELRSGRTDGYIKPEIVREVWQEHIDELEVERESISAKLRSPRQDLPEFLISAA